MFQNFCRSQPQNKNELYVGRQKYHTGKLSIKKLKSTLNAAFVQKKIEPYIFFVFFVS